MLRYVMGVRQFVFGKSNLVCLPALRGLASSSKYDWGYRQMTLFQEIVGGYGLSSADCDQIVSSLVAKDYRGMFRRIEQNLNYAKLQGLGKEQTRHVLMKNVNFFTGRPNVFKDRWKALVYEFDLTRDEMNTLIARFPLVLDISYHEKTKPLIGLFQEWGITFSEFRKVFLKYPQVLRHPIDSRIIPFQSVLLNEGFRGRDIGAMIRREPTLLRRSAIEIRTRLKELRKFGLSTDELISLLTDSPILLKYSLEKRVQWFEALLGTEGRTIMKTLLVGAPAIFTGSMNLLSHKLKIMSSHGIYKPDQRSLLSHCPIVLNLSSEELDERLQLVKRLGKAPRDVVACPQFLLFPLTQLRSRVLFFLETSTRDDKELFFFTLDDDTFVKGLGVEMHEYLSYTRQEKTVTKRRIIRVLTDENVEDG